MALFPWDTWGTVLGTMSRDYADAVNTTNNTNKPMPQNIFEVAMIERPTTEQREQGVKDKLILPPMAVMAETAQQAIAVVTQTKAEELKGHDLATMEIITRQFRG